MSDGEKLFVFNFPFFVKIIVGASLTISHFITRPDLSFAVNSLSISALFCLKDHSFLLSCSTLCASQPQRNHGSGTYVLHSVGAYLTCMHSVIPTGPEAGASTQWSSNPYSLPSCLLIYEPSNSHPITFVVA
jgi:hypothetical protein